MMRALAALASPLLLKLEPETAHRATIAALRLAPRTQRPCDPRLSVDVFGIAFPNPLGLAAGFDKNAQVARGLLAAGFGFVEVGTVTPRPQPGNARPRLFRLRRDGALINRLGFNNDGYEAAHARLSRRPPHGIVGVNIGPNKDSLDRIADYVLGVKTFADVARYFTINISSPNTPGLRDLQQRGALDELIARVIDARDACAVRRPVLVKIAPDVDLMTLDDIVSVGRARGVDGMIVANTTISRPPSLVEPDASQIGGLSGTPCSICRHEPSRGHFCAPKAPSPWSAVAASTTRHRLWRRSKRGRTSCNSIPPWSIAALRSSTKSCAAWRKPSANGGLRESAMQWASRRAIGPRRRAESAGSCLSAPAARRAGAATATPARRRLRQSEDSVQTDGSR